VFRLGGDYRLVAGADLQFASSQYLTADFIQSGRDDGYVVYDVDVQLEKGSTWSLQTWGRNLSNEAIYTGGLRYPVTLPGGDPTLFYADIRPPRTYGLTFAYHF
jgi:outer membrane receptor protein involved in Fe transport